MSRRGARHPRRFADGRLRRVLAPGLVPVAALLVAAAPPEALLGNAAASSSGAISVDVTGASTATTLNLEVCSSVEFTANGITGRPPLVVTWDTDLGEIFAVNPVSLDTSSYVGAHRVTVHVTNAFGSASYDTFFQVDALAVPTPVAISPNPSPDLSVVVSGAPVGATDWQWLWGDGTISTWTTACGASHTYPHPGTYMIELRGRSCNAGPTDSDPLFVRVRNGMIFGDDFEGGGLGAWSGSG